MFNYIKDGIKAFIVVCFLSFALLCIVALIKCSILYLNTVTSLENEANNLLIAAIFAIIGFLIFIFIPTKYTKLCGNYGRNDFRQDVLFFLNILLPFFVMAHWKEPIVAFVKMLF